MIVIVISEVDEASKNIGNHLLKLSGWQKFELEFEDRPVYQLLRTDSDNNNGDGSNSSLLLTIPKLHLEADELDVEIQSKLGVKPSCIIFASRHRSLSGKPTLAVHPPGNFGTATTEFGGRSYTLVPSAPYLMTRTLNLIPESISELNLQLNYSITFEVTHHGPYLTTPAFFIEIGSVAEHWHDSTAGMVLALSLFKLINTEAQLMMEKGIIAVGIGGTHYAPRFTELARKPELRIYFGHMIPNYVIEPIADDKNKLKHILEEAIVKTTPQTDIVFVHRKALKSQLFKKIESLIKLEFDYLPIVQNEQKLVQLL